jgi:hypothetical protein
VNLIEALKRCQEGQRVRPVCWRTLNPGHWVEALPTPLSADPCIFVEKGAREEMPHALRLQFPTEFLGEWEVVP